MGQLPTHFASQEIMQRTPYCMNGDMIISPGVSAQLYPEATFLNAINRPFEIHRIIPRIVGLDADGLVIDPQADQDLLGALVQAAIENLTANDKLTKVPTFVNLLTKGSAERTWEWADPYYLPNGHQFTIALTTTSFFGADDPASLRVSFNFQGFLIKIAPASEAR